jgi:hypothetical protein
VPWSFEQLTDADAPTRAHRRRERFQQTDSSFEKESAWLPGENENVKSEIVN